MYVKARINPAMMGVGAQVGVLRYANGQEWLVVNARPYAALDHQGLGQTFMCSMDDVKEMKAGPGGAEKVDLAKLPRFSRPGTIDDALGRVFGPAGH